MNTPLPRPELHISTHPKGFILGTAKNAMKTRGGVPVTVPTAALAEALKAEWESAAKDAPFYALTCFTLDALLPHRAEREAELLAYLETDTLRYHAPEDALQQRQLIAWEPRLQALEAAFHLHLPRTTGILPLEAPADDAQAKLRSFLDDLDIFTLTGFYQATQITHSFTLGWHLLTGHTTPEETFALAFLEQSYQCEQWGQDEEAEKALTEKAKMLKILDSWFCSLRQR